MILRRIIPLTVLALAMLFLSNALAEQPAKVPARQPLTYRDSGIYGWWQPYFFDCPFDYIITQAIVLPGEFSPPGTNNASDLEHIKIWNDRLKKARAAGKRVLVVCSPGQGQVCTEPYFQALERFLDNVDHEELYAITLSEENISSAEFVSALTAGYHRIKKKFPDLPIYQWYTCSSRSDARPGFTWPLLPSDGWLADEYVATPDDFEQAVRRYRMLGKPFVNIVWAAPFYSSSKQTSVPYHQGIFDGQLRVSQKYDVPTAFFCWDGPIGRFSPWEEQGQQENKDVFKRVLDSISKAKSLPTEALLDWDDAAKPVKTVLAKSADGSFAYREDYDLWTGGADQKPPADDFIARSQIRGLRHLRWMPDPARIVACSDGDDKAIDASIVNQWVAPQAQPVRFTASANVIVEAGASPEVIFEVSPNAYDWVAKAVAKESGVLKVDLPEAQSMVYTRLRVAGKSAKPGEPLAAIDWIEVRGDTAK